MHYLYDVYRVQKILMCIYPLEATNIVFPLFIRYYKSMIKECLYIELFLPLTFLTSKTEINSYKKKGFTFKEKKIQ